MILVPGTKLEAVLAGAVAANQPVVTVDYVDWNPQGVMTNRAQFRVAMNNTTLVTILAAPVANAVREVLRINVYNVDTSSVTWTLNSDDGTTDIIEVKIAIATLKTLQWMKYIGWLAAP